MDASGNLYGTAVEGGVYGVNLQAATGAFQGTIPGGAYPSGVTAGEYLDSSFASHGFSRGADGTPL